jgi:ribonuclease R
VYVRPVKDRRSETVATVGDKVVVRLEPWESRHVNPEGDIIEILGPASAPGVDMLSIIRKYHLPTEFPGDVIDQANRISETVDARKLEGREDLRKKFIVTIDPDDARDFDDAIHVEKIDNAGWRLGVHIADVAAYVEPGSALDREARRRGNSVYLPDRVIPMLPERLSNGVCSLNPGVDRLTHSVFIQFDKMESRKAHASRRA